MTEKKQTTILVTDSGLGGLSVFSGLATGLAQDARYRKIRLIYFNAWPMQYKGYNHYPDMNARARVFHNAMTAMAGFHPDHIYIACNTLSVIYPFTEFAGAPPVPVTGIIDHGVDMIQEKLIAHPKGQVIVFGTPATVEARTHETALIKRGIASSRIMGQPCLNLAGKIERDPFGEETAGLIAEYTTAAADLLDSNGGPVFAALCCTHFNYCQEAFRAGLAASGRPVEIINPNQGMVSRAIDNALAGGGPDIDMEIYSRVTWEENRINAYDALLASDAPQVVQALKAYTLDRDLFNIDI
jgi:glutamate racemase